MSFTTSGKYIYAGKAYPNYTVMHRAIMHTIDPRENEDELVVHHIDGNKSNNDPSNLMWMTKSEHLRWHHLGENHFPCSGKDNANYRHGMCVGKRSPEYKRFHNHKTYMAHRAERLAKQNAYGAEHREHKRWYDKVRHWTKQLEIAETDERKQECTYRLNELKENPV